MQAMLFGLVATDMSQLIMLVMVLGTAALVAAYLPARRAAAIDPMSALRQP
jgi:ABC-type lipoprotein release transport system permease subunit